MSKVPGRLYAAGSALFVLCGFAHMLGQFLPTTPDPGSEALERSMRTLVIPGTTFTYWRIMQCWGALYGGMTVALGVMLLAVVRASGDVRVRRTAARVGVAAAVLQTACVLIYATPPPAFFMVPAAILLLLAAVWREKAET